MTEELDETDWSILAEVQRDGRIPFTELGPPGEPQRLGHHRARQALEALGVISGYRADVDLTKVGYAILAVVRLKYPGNRHEPLRRLLGERMEILECLRTTGEDCYTLKVAAGSMAHLESIVDELARFGSTTTNLVYSQPLPYRGPPDPAPVTVSPARTGPRPARSTRTRRRARRPPTPGTTPTRAAAGCGRR
ncbi:Lrp/AsnC family transcriptional regulator [Nonomuraea rubra]|uniref:Lrp/AsnC family transcriptional regulator n=1 Tax=Nonomuraea rubra TaxID=46180 RepID=UPI0031ED5883